MVNGENFQKVFKHIGTKAAIGCNQVDDGIWLTEYPGHTKMYEAVTEYCGFPAIEAGKLMGLAPYGKPNDELPDFFSNGWGNRELIIPTYIQTQQRLMLVVIQSNEGCSRA